MAQGLQANGEVLSSPLGSKTLSGSQAGTRQLCNTELSSDSPLTSVPGFVRNVKAGSGARVRGYQGYGGYGLAADASNYSSAPRPKYDISNSPAAVQLRSLHEHAAKGPIYIGEVASPPRSPDNRSKTDNSRYTDKVKTLLFLRSQSPSNQANPPPNLQSIMSVVADGDTSQNLQNMSLGLNMQPSSLKKESDAGGAEPRSLMDVA